MKSFIYFFSLIITTICLAQTQILATKSGVDTNGRGSYTYQFLNSQNEKCIYDYYDGVLIWNDIGSKEYFCYAKRGENLELRMLNNFQNKYLIDTPNELKVTEVKKNSDSANIDEKNKEIKLSNLLTQIGNLNDVNGKRTEYYDKSKTTVILNQNEIDLTIITNFDNGELPYTEYENGKIKNKVFYKSMSSKVKFDCKNLNLISAGDEKYFSELNLNGNLVAKNDGIYNFTKISPIAEYKNKIKTVCMQNNLINYINPNISENESKKNNDQNKNSIEVVNNSSIKNLIETYRQNENRFLMNYRGKIFNDEVNFEQIYENKYYKYTYTAYFSTSNVNIFCTDIVDQNLIRLLSNLNKHDKINLKGIVNDVSLGDLKLSSCYFKK